VELLYITPTLPVPVQHLSVASRTTRTKLRMARVVLPSKFMLHPYKQVTSTDEQDNLYQQFIKHNGESESSKIKEYVNFILFFMYFVASFCSFFL
jgi:hypothetical protein